MVEIVYLGKYWENRVKTVSEISKKYGFSEQTIEFWDTKPCGIISLITIMEEKIKEVEETIQKFINKEYAS